MLEPVGFLPGQVEVPGEFLDIAKEPSTERAVQSVADQVFKAKVVTSPPSMGRRIVSIEESEDESGYSSASSRVQSSTNLRTFGSTPLHEIDAALEIVELPEEGISEAEYMQLKANFSDKLTRDLSGFELDLLLKLLEESPENQEAFANWLILVRQDQGHQARKEIQKFLNKHIKFSDALQISYHQKLKKWKMKSTTQKVKSVAYSGAKAVFLPLIVAGKIAKSTGKLVVSKDFRKEVKSTLRKMFKSKTYSYQTRKKMASAVLKFGMTGIVALAIAGELGSGGLATPAIVGIVATTLGALAKVGNDVAKGKSSAQTLGSLLADCTSGGVEGACVTGFYTGVSEVLDLIFQEVYSDDR